MYLYPEMLGSTGSAEVPVDPHVSLSQGATITSLVCLLPCLRRIAFESRLAVSPVCLSVRPSTHPLPSSFPGISKQQFTRMHKTQANINLKWCERSQGGEEMKWD